MQGQIYAKPIPRRRPSLIIVIRNLEVETIDDIYSFPGCTSLRNTHSIHAFESGIKRALDNLAPSKQNQTRHQRSLFIWFRSLILKRRLRSDHLTSLRDFPSNFPASIPTQPSRVTSRDPDTLLLVPEQDIAQCITRKTSTPVPVHT